MRAVLKKLPHQVHTQSMTMASLTTSGTPDQYIDLHSDLWVEFKWNSGYPRVLDGSKMLSDLQKQWLLRRYTAGRNACVIVGFPHLNHNCGVILDTPVTWTTPFPRAQFTPMIKTIPELAAYLLNRVSNHALHEAHSHAGLLPLATRRALQTGHFTP